MTDLRAVRDPPERVEGAPWPLRDARFVPLARDRSYFFEAAFFVVAAFLPAFSLTSWWLMRFLQVRSPSAARGTSAGILRPWALGGRFAQDERLPGGVSISQRPIR